MTLEPGTLRDVAPTALWHLGIDPSATNMEGHVVGVSVVPEPATCPWIVFALVIEPLKAVAKTLRNRRELLLNWFRADGTLSSGVVEGFNNKLKLITRKSYGFRTQEAYQTALYHNLGALPEPEYTHRFV